MCVGAVLMTSAARSASVTVPVSVGPGGMVVLNPANVTAHHGDTVKWTCDSSGHTTTDTTAEPATEHQSRACHSGPAAVQRPVCTQQCSEPYSPGVSGPGRIVTGRFEALMRGRVVERWAVEGRDVRAGRPV